MSVDAIHALAAGARDHHVGVCAYDDGPGHPLWFDRIVKSAGTDAAAAAERLKAAMPKLDAERVQRVQDMANDLMAKAGLDEARRQQLEVAMQDLTNKGNQAIVAGLKLGTDAASQVGAKAKSLLEELIPKAKKLADDAAKAAGEAVRGAKERLAEAKKSEDFSGMRAVIAQEIYPVLQAQHPGLFKDARSINGAAEGIRMAMEVYANGGKDSVTAKQAFKLIALMGDNAVGVLDTVANKLGTMNPEERERFYGAMNALTEIKKADDQTLALMEKSRQKGVETAPRRCAATCSLRSWAEGEGGAVKGSGYTKLAPGDRKGAKTTPVQQTEQGKFFTESMKAVLASRYDNVEQILEAVSREAEGKDNMLADESALVNDTDVQDAESRHVFADTKFYGFEIKHTSADGKPSKTRTGMALLPQHSDDAEKNQITGAMARAEKDNPGKTVSTLTAKELGDDHPIVQRKLKDLINEAAAMGLEGEDADAYAKKEIGKYGIVAAEGSYDMPGLIDRDNIRKVTVAKEGEKAKDSHLKDPSPSASTARPTTR